jgi:uncharacterized protein (DUF58 family)
MTFSQRVVLLLLAASLLAGIVTGSNLYYRLAYLWIFVLVGSYGMSRLALRGIHFTRMARSLRAQVGQIFEERFEIYNTSWLPRLWLEVRDETPLPGTRGSQVLSLINKRESRTYLVRTRLMERGVFPLGQTVLSSGDIFGIFPVSRIYPPMDSLLVYPMMVEVHAFPSPHGWLSGGEALRRRTHQITANAAGVREYAPGDPLNRIHWLSTARRNRLIVKEFELDPLAEVWIFVDASRYVHSQIPGRSIKLEERDLWRSSVKIPLPPSSEEYAVSIAASLARFFLQRGRAVGLVYAGRIFSVLSAERGGRQLGKILETLALMHADGRMPLQSLVDTQIRSLPRGSTAILITPSTGNEVALSAELLSRRGMRPVAVLLDSSSFGGSPGSNRVATNLELIGIPTCLVAYEDDLTTKLSEAARNQVWV